jgi:hypothetical protein
VILEAFNPRQMCEKKNGKNMPDFYIWLSVVAKYKQDD